ncbi:lysozyme C, milk isozyme-like [Varanus komodoensis]|uniref:lysozyme C, milk isozyme-like n=1 Tax=Varanus komodoensis TaxID=61221 RepID=UPI001CF772CE|nr:lysozyme C, milk isozyme-like [Varanus komodoensis]
MTGLVLAFLCLLSGANEARKYSKCEMYEELIRRGLENYHGIGIGHWICLIMFSSRYNTEHYEFQAGHPSYGLFYLSGLKWCHNGRHLTENLCNTDCEKFLDDDISDDIECAKKVADSKRGMLSWTRYSEYCRHPMPEIVFWECVKD